MPRVEGQNWIVDPRRPPPVLGRPVTGAPGNGPLPQGITGGDQGYTRQVQPNELISTHAENLSRGNNRLIQMARMRGTRAGAARAGVNSQLAAAAGEDAALGQVAEMAGQQAGAYGNAATQNLDSLARQRMSAEGNETSIRTADIGAGASMYNADLDFESTRLGREQDRDLTLSGRDFTRSEREGEQGWRSGESQRERDYNTGRDERQFGYQQRLNEDQFRYGEQEQDNAARRDSDSYMFRQLIDNPEEFSPEVLEGLQSFFTRFRQPRAYAKPGGGGG